MNYISNEFYLKALIKIGEHSFIYNQTMKQYCFIVSICTSLENTCHVASKVLYVFPTVYGALYILKNFLKNNNISRNNILKPLCSYCVLIHKRYKILYINVNAFSINSLGLYFYLVGNQNFKYYFK